MDSSVHFPAEKNVVESQGRKKGGFRLNGFGKKSNGLAGGVRWMKKQLKKEDCDCERGVGGQDMQGCDSGIWAANLESGRFAMGWE